MKNETILLLILSMVLGMFVIYAYNVKHKEDPIVQDHGPQPWTPLDSEPEPPTRPATFEDALNSITTEELKSNVYKLADDEWEGRMSGKKGNKLAAAWIKQRFENFGLPTMYDRFSIERMNPGPHNETGDNFTQNIYAWIEGSDPELKDEIVVVGAHMDHIGYGPRMSRASNRREIHNGADDNASGTSALMEIAQAMAMLKPKRTVVFQAYSAEEMGLIGSRYYCNNPKFPQNNPDIRKHVFMLNMDMIGYLDKGYYFVGWHDGESSIDISQIIRELNQKYSFADRITSRRGGGSDHASFYNKRIPVASLHTGLHRWYHTPDDTSDKLNYPGMEKIAKYAFELAWRVANDSTRPRFNHAEFKELPYVHDHGHPGVPFYLHSYHRLRFYDHRNLQPPNFVEDTNDK